MRNNRNYRRNNYHRNQHNQHIPPVVIQNQQVVNRLPIDHRPNYYSKILVGGTKLDVLKKLITSHKISLRGQGANLPVPPVYTPLIDALLHYNCKYALGNDVVYHDLGNYDALGLQDSANLNAKHLHILPTEITTRLLARWAAMDRYILVFDMDLIGRFSDEFSYRRDKDGNHIVNWGKRMKSFVGYNLLQPGFDDATNVGYDCERIGPVEESGLFAIYHVYLNPDAKAIPRDALTDGLTREFIKFVEGSDYLEGEYKIYVTDELIGIYINTQLSVIPVSLLAELNNIIINKKPGYNYIQETSHIISRACSSRFAKSDSSPGYSLGDTIVIRHLLTTFCNHMATEYGEKLIYFTAPVVQALNNKLTETLSLLDGKVIWRHWSFYVVLYWMVVVIFMVLMEIVTLQTKTRLTMATRITALLACYCIRIILLFVWVFIVQVSTPGTPASLAAQISKIAEDIFSLRTILYAIVTLLVFGIIPTVAAATGDIVVMCCTTSMVSILVTCFIALLCLRQAKRDFVTWDNFKEEITQIRQTTVSSTFPVRPNDPFRKQEPWYPINKDTMDKVDPGFSMIVGPPTKETWRDSGGVEIYGPVFCGVAPIVFSRSQLTELVAVTNRAMDAKVPFTSAEKWQNITIFSDVWLKITGVNGRFTPPVSMYVHPLTHQPRYMKHATFKEWIARFPKRKRDLINQAHEDLATRVSQSYVFKAFAKMEKVSSINRDTYQPVKPRTISACSDKMKADFGQFFYNLGLCIKHTWNITNTIWFCSGASTDEFNWWINDALERIKDPVFICIDESSFDQSQGKEATDALFKFYDSCGMSYMKWSAEAKQALKFNKNRANGFSYKRVGRNNSGAPDTTVRNTWMNGNVVGEFFQHLSENWYNYTAMAILGDDNFIVCSWEWLKKFYPTYEALRQDMADRIRSYGFIPKIKITNLLEKAEFISKRWYAMTDGTYVMGVMPGKVMSKIGYFMYEEGRKLADKIAILAGTLKSLMPTGLHIPIFRYYIQDILAHIGEYVETKKSKQYFDTMYFVRGSIVNKKIDWFGFTEVYQITPMDEIRFHENLVKALQTYGLLCVVNDPSVEQMVAVDLDFHKNAVC